MTPRSDAIRSQRRIIEAATELLAEDPAASMEEIASAAGVGRATVHRHFSTRAALLRAVFVAALEELATAVRSADLAHLAPIPALDAVLDAVLEVPRAYRVLVRATTPEEDEEIRERFEAIVEVVGEVITRARDAGLVRDDLSDEWVADVWSAITLVALERVVLGSLPVEAATHLVRKTLWPGIGTAPARRQALVRAP
jgi:AcrR family transcriptional regulator